MKLSETNILELLPGFMRSDEANIALAAGINAVALDAFAKIRAMTVWDKIDELSDSDLDELAWALDIRWYKSTADIATKRAVVKASDLLHAKLGTPWAVEKMLGDYFGSAVVREAWTYAGQPGHFKLLTTNPAVTNESLAEAMALLEIAKRKSSWLDDISVVLTGDQQLYVGMAVHDWTHDTETLGDTAAIIAEASAST